MRRRAFLGTLGAGLIGARLADARQATREAPPVRRAKTTTLFKSPEGYPNAIAATREGLWIGEQKTDHACLVDWNGKLQKTVTTESKNTKHNLYFLVLRVFVFSCDLRVFVKSRLPAYTFALPCSRSIRKM